MFLFAFFNPLGPIMAAIAAIAMAVVQGIISVAVAIAKGIAGLEKTWHKEIGAFLGDGRLCLKCNDLDGESISAYRPWVTTKGFVFSPPLHPNCRCHMIYSLHGQLLGPG